MSIPNFKVGDKVEYGVVDIRYPANGTWTVAIWQRPGSSFPSWHIHNDIDPFSNHEFTWNNAIVTSVSPMKVATTDEKGDSVNWPGKDNIHSTEELWKQKWFLRLAR